MSEDSSSCREEGSRAMSVTLVTVTECRVCVRALIGDAEGGSDLFDSWAVGEATHATGTGGWYRWGEADVGRL